MDRTVERAIDRDRLEADLSLIVGTIQRLLNPQVVKMVGTGLRMVGVNLDLSRLISSLPRDLARALSDGEWSALIGLVRRELDAIDHPGKGEPAHLTTPEREAIRKLVAAMLSR